MEEIDRYSGRFREEKGFLVVEGAVDHGDSFDIKMLLNNQIAGILPLQIQYIDNQCIYRYLTGEKISLTRFLSHQKLHFKEAYRLWKDIFHSCSICAEYLLQTSCCYVRNIFTGILQCKVSLFAISPKRQRLWKYRLKGFVSFF